MTNEEREAKELERKQALKKLEEQSKKTDELYAKAFDKPEPTAPSEAALSE